MQFQILLWHTFTIEEHLSVPTEQYHVFNVFSLSVENVGFFKLLCFPIQYYNKIK